ncbi:MAG: BTAD domain-containing putative transcriptional regulator [Ktedonobacteraceae bacterium]
MNPSFSSLVGAITFAHVELSLIHLLAYGLQCFRQGCYAEGITFFALVREQLPPDQIQLASALEMLKRRYISYANAQEELLQACKRFTQADAEQQAQVAVVENLLPILGGKTEESLYVQVGHRGSSEGDTLLYLPRSSFSDLNSEKRLTQATKLKQEDDINHQSLPSLQQLSGDDTTIPALYVTCFGRFAVNRAGKTLDLCSSRKGQAILRYFIAQEGHKATIDTLMVLLWPEDEPEVAQSKLHSAISALRRSLNYNCGCDPGYTYILCKNRVYYLNPSVVIQTDVDEFLQCYQAGIQTSRERAAQQAALYERACRLYTGPFLPEDLYADWSFLQREQLSQIYLTMCRALTDYYIETKKYEDAAKWATAVLKVNHCDEAAHLQLIQVYAAQGRRSEAFQQYQRCERILREELGMTPLPETTREFQRVFTSESCS